MFKNSVFTLFFWAPVVLLLVVLLTNSTVAIAYFMRIVTIVICLFALKKLLSTILDNGFNHPPHYKKTLLKQYLYIIIAATFFLKFHLDYSDFKDYVTKLSAEASQQCVAQQTCNTPLLSWQNKSDFRESDDKKTSLQSFTYTNAFNWHIKNSHKKKPSKFTLIMVQMDLIMALAVD